MTVISNLKLLTLVLSIGASLAQSGVSELDDTDLLQHISASVNYLWSTTIEDEVWMCEEPCNGTWVLVDGSLKQVDASDTEVWGIDSTDMIYKAPIDGITNRTFVPGQMKHISASGNGYVWAIGSRDVVKSHALESGRQLMVFT